MMLSATEGERAENEGILIASSTQSVACFTHHRHRRRSQKESAPTKPGRSTPCLRRTRSVRDKDINFRCSRRISLTGLPVLLSQCHRFLPPEVTKNNSKYGHVSYSDIFLNAIHSCDLSSVFLAHGYFAQMTSVDPISPYPLFQDVPRVLAALHDQGARLHDMRRGLREGAGTGENCLEM